MNNNYQTLLIVILTLVFGIAARFLLARLLRETRPAGCFRMLAGLFLLYTLVMLLMLWQVYLYMSQINCTVQDYYHAVIMTVCAINTAAVFIGIVYHSIREKHRLSSDDKMKLMDM